MYNEVPFAEEYSGYGGIFRMNFYEDFQSLDPLQVTDLTSMIIADQVYDGLVKKNPITKEIEPCLAKAYDISENGRIYTFQIREGVFFHDNPCFTDGKGKELTADDVVFSFTRLFTNSTSNRLYPLWANRIAGADAFYQEERFGDNDLEQVEGIQKIDDYTVRFILTESFPGFLELLSTHSVWIYPQEAYELYREEFSNNPVGTGPFFLKKLVSGQVVVLQRNPLYWRKDSVGRALPYLDGIKFTFESDRNIEMKAFMQGRLDMVFDPLRSTVELYNIRYDRDLIYETDSFLVQVYPSLSLQFYGFKHSGTVFNDVNVRKAFNLAIDREQIVEEVLNGRGIPAKYGMVPPFFKKYHADSLEGYSFDPELAKVMLAFAGYPGGKGFPRITLHLNNGGGFSNLGVAELVQSMLRDNLGVVVDLSVTDRKTHYELVESGQSAFWKDSWIADYYDPSTFLSLFFSGALLTDTLQKSYLNTMRYASSEYDSLYLSALHTQDFNKRMSLYLKADQKALDDAVVMPLYYDKMIRLLSKRVQNFPAQPMEIRDLTEVYFTEDARP
jgi:oligopeptide transport system substrate-binding protein